MPGTARLLTLALRALMLLLAASALWMFLASPYNRLIVSVAAPFTPDGFSFKVNATRIFLEGPGLGPPVSMDGFALHWGLVLMAVLVLAAVGLSVRSRLKWLALMAAATLTAQALGLVMLAYGAALVARNGGDNDEAKRLLFSAFAVVWGLLPAVAGGLWCFAFWLPRARAGVKTHDGQLVHNKGKQV